jgi:hypothetical protein
MATKAFPRRFHTDYHTLAEFLGIFRYCSSLESAVAGSGGLGTALRSVYPRFIAKIRLCNYTKKRILTLNRDMEKGDYFLALRLLFAINKQGRMQL